MVVIDEEMHRLLQKNDIFTSSNKFGYFLVPEGGSKKGNVEKLLSVPLLLSPINSKIKNCDDPLRNAPWNHNFDYCVVERTKFSWLIARHAVEDFFSNLEKIICKLNLSNAMISVFTWELCISYKSKNKNVVERTWGGGGNNFFSQTFPCKWITWINQQNWLICSCA